MLPPLPLISAIPAGSRLVLDAGPMLAHFKNETDGPAIAQLCANNMDLVYAHAVNVGEVFYQLYREQGGAAAHSVTARLIHMGVMVRNDMDAAFWQDAMTLKAIHVKVSLADCYLMAMARRVGATVVTTDRHEMGPLVPTGICPIYFLR